MIELADRQKTSCSQFIVRAQESYVEKNADLKDLPHVPPSRDVSGVSYRFI